MTRSSILGIKLKRLLILLGILFLFSCNYYCGSCTDEYLVGTWLIEDAIDNNTDDVINYPESITEQIITFESIGYIINNCNIRGEYSIKDRQIRFYDFMLTEMYCNSTEFMDWEQILALNLEGNCEYEINGNELRITTNNAYSFGFRKHN